MQLRIAEVARETGIGKETLRAWERRYGFPKPSRDARGDRCYPLQQVHQLIIIRRLLDAGLRAGTIVPPPHDKLMTLLRNHADDVANTMAQTAITRQLLAMLAHQDARGIHALLQQQWTALGLEEFLLRVAAPMCVLVGAQWASGELSIYQEHLFTLQLESVLRDRIAGIRRTSVPGDRPRVLLMTVPDELHHLGLLMTEAWLTALSADCINLGPQVPTQQMQQACIDIAPDIVGVSFSLKHRHEDALGCVRQLRASLATTIELWAGGSLWSRSTPGVDGVRFFVRLEEITDALGQWRAAHRL